MEPVFFFGTEMTNIIIKERRSWLSEHCSGVISADIRLSTCLQRLFQLVSPEKPVNYVLKTYQNRYLKGYTAIL